MSDVIEAAEAGWRVVRFLRAVVSRRPRERLADEWLAAPPLRAAGMIAEGTITALVIAVVIVAVWRAAA